jgi:predicted molibdopterin-dependent oxidoreductase YjgC
VIESLPRKDGETGEREACTRGRFAVVELNRSVQRLKSPLLRRGGELVEVPWESALAAAAEGIRRAHPERSALVYSGSCTNEDIFVAHQFARDVLRTPHVDSVGSLRACSRPAGAMRRSAGSPISRRPRRCWWSAGIRTSRTRCSR